MIKLPVYLHEYHDMFDLYEGTAAGWGFASIC